MCCRCEGEDNPDLRQDVISFKPFESSSSPHLGTKGFGRVCNGTMIATDTIIATTLTNSYSGDSDREVGTRNDDKCEALCGNDKTLERVESTTASKSNNNSVVAASSVAFSTIEIREYPIITGDNPAVTRGVPITIAWIPLPEQQCYDVEDYEKHRPSRNRRSRLEMRRRPSERTALLRSLGASRDEILQGTKAANIARNRRKRTSETIQLARAQEACEMIARAMRNATVRRTRKINERKMLERCRSMGMTKDWERDDATSLTTSDESSVSVTIG